MKAIKQILVLVVIIVCGLTNLNAQRYDPYLSRSLVGISAGYNAACGIILVSSLTVNTIRATSQPGNFTTTDGYGNASVASDNNNNVGFVVPPRVVIGVTSIALGGAIVHFYKRPIDALEKRTFRLGIADIVMGSSVIVIPPLINLLFTGNDNSHKKKKKATPPVDMGIYMPHNSTGRGFGFSFAKVF